MYYYYSTEKMEEFNRFIGLKISADNYIYKLIFSPRKVDIRIKNNLIPLLSINYNRNIYFKLILDKIYYHIHNQKSNH